MKEKRMFEIRKFSQDEGTFDAYVATWDTIDSFGTRFKRGAFRKTIQERLAKGDIKILWQHKIDEPIGVVLGAKEDEHGLLVNGKLDIGVPRADQSRLQMASGTINQFSFGFDIIKQKRNPDDGYIDISEVRWWEASPVTFAANPETSLVNVRSSVLVREKDDEGKVLVEAEEGTAFTEHEGSILVRELNLEDELGGGAGPESLPIGGDGPSKEDSDPPPSSDTRSTDFDDTLNESELMSRGWMILNALMDTLWDIWYGYDEVPDVVVAVDEAFEKAHASYVDWASELVSTNTRAIDPRKNDLSEAMAEEVGERSIEQVAKDSPLSADEIRTLMKGNLLPLEARGRLAEFSNGVAEAHSKLRGEVVYKLFQEIRAKGFSQPEFTRLRALLRPEEEDDGIESSKEAEEALSSLRSFNSSFDTN